MTINLCETCVHYDSGYHSPPCMFCDPPFEDRYMPMYNDHDIYENEDDTNDRDETYNADRG